MTRSRKYTLNHRPMRDRKNGVSSKISANGKIWDMMKQQILTKALYIKKQKSKRGYETELTVYECEDCTGCPHKEKCTYAKGNKRWYISKSFLEKR